MRIGILASGDLGLRVLNITRADSRADVVFVGIAERGDYAANTRILSAVGEANVLSLGQMIRPDEMVRIRAATPDLILLAWWPYIVGRELLEVPRHGCLNFHPGPLPATRGMDPYVWALRGGASRYGVCINYVDETVDGGDVAFAKSMQVSWEATGSDLRAMAIGALVDLYRKKLETILDGDVPRRKQPYGPVPHRRRELHRITAIDLDAPTTARELLNLIRARMVAVSPGCATFVDDGRTYGVTVEIRELGQDN